LSGATVDVAIWSTVEQGLAITAGSLATLRPLMKQVNARLGWSTPCSARLSEYPAVTSGRLYGRRTWIANTMDTVPRGSIKEVDEGHDFELAGQRSAGCTAGTGHEAQFVSTKLLKSAAANMSLTSTFSTSGESQENLRLPIEDMDEGNRRGIIVPRTWIVTQMATSKTELQDH
jgi:hypothetical protein